MENRKPAQITERLIAIADAPSPRIVRRSRVESRQTAATGHFLFSLFHFHYL
jgi:hypothetical protein